MQFSSLIGLCLLLAGSAACAQPRAEHNLSFSRLPGRWEEGLPLGNGLLGCLVWQKDGRLRLSLDRADLWDTRPMAGLDRPEFNYRWVAAQVAKGEYGLVQEYFDAPYEREAGPTKLPGAALEFRLKGIAQMPAKLDLGNGLAIVGSVNKGYVVHTFVHARRREGWFRLRDGRGGAIEPELAPPPYAGDTTEAAGGSVRGDALARLRQEYDISRLFVRTLRVHRWDDEDWTEAWLRYASKVHAGGRVVVTAPWFTTYEPAPEEIATMLPPCCCIASPACLIVNAVPMMLRSQA